MILLLLQAVMCGGLMGACSDPTEPALRQPGPALTVGLPVECGRIKFTITGTNTVTALYPPQPNCGGTGMVLIQFASITWVTGTRTLTIAMRVKSTSTSTLYLPVWVELPVSGKTVLQRTGTSNTKIVP